MKNNSNNRCVTKGKWVGRCVRKSWELISPDVTFCLRGMFSPLLLGFRAPFAPDTCITVARALNIHTSLSSTPSFTYVSFPSIFSSLLRISTLFHPTICLCGYECSYSFIHVVRLPFIAYHCSVKRSRYREAFQCFRIEFFT